MKFAREMGKLGDVLGIDWEVFLFLGDFVINIVSFRCEE